MKKIKIIFVDLTHKRETNEADKPDGIKEVRTFNKKMEEGTKIFSWAKFQQTKSIQKLPFVLVLVNFDSKLHKI